MLHSILPIKHGTLLKRNVRRDRLLDIWYLDTESPSNSSRLATYCLFQRGQSAGHVSLYGDLVAFWCAGRRIAVFNWRLSRQDDYLAAVIQITEMKSVFREPVRTYLVLRCAPGFLLLF